MKAVELTGSAVRILDQTRLPHHEVVVDAASVEDVARSIRRLAVRGAPLLGIVAGYGMALAAATGTGGMDELEQAGALLIASRPTAVNISWAVQRVLRAAAAAAGRGSDAVARAVLEEARRIGLEDEASCTVIGRLGGELLPAFGNVLTHCNTGELATGGIGTAQGMIVTAHRSGKRLHVWVDETRPVQQGARLTAWELQRAGVPMTLVADTAAGSLMARGMVDAVAVGADRIAANGDVANKVGTYPLAILAAHFGIPFYVAAPFSTVDLAVRTGREIAIEERDADEVLTAGGVPVAPAGTPVANPAFDVTPGELVTAIVTDRGVANSPFPASLDDLSRAPGPAIDDARLQEVS
jgi:methylthioribose-1-phosphate isomerase